MTATFPVVNAFVTVAPQPTAHVVDDYVSIAPGIASTITVERADGTQLSEIEADWRELIARAHEPNVFMDPAIICLLGGRCVTLLAWQSKQDSRKLVGLWAFQVSRQWPVRVLRSPPFAHAYLATPVVARTDTEAALHAMLDFIARSSDLPKLISLDPIRSDGPTMQMLARVLQTRGNVPCIFSEAQRPILASDLDGKAYFEQALSSSSRKKLRQHRRRLEEKGALENRVCTAPADVSKALEDFLQLEVSGWKGRRGTALLCNEPEVGFARTMIAALAQRSNASIHALYQQGKPVASQVVLRAGSAAFTWKTAYDEGLGDYSPGMLLLENYTTAFLADKSIAMVDSCAFDDSGFMSAWKERETIAQVLFHAGHGGSPVFLAVAGLQKVFLKLRTTAKTLYLLGRRQWMRS